MIDLSYLTEEEQEMIMTVLQRDAELKRAEEERVRQLQRLPSDRGTVKYMTGEWFYEAKSQRHMDRIHGSDIIRASMKFSDQSWTARTGRISHGNQDLLTSPEPLGQKEEPPKQPKEDRESGNASPDPPQERLKPALRSPAKRHNPFNRASLVLSETPGETESQLADGAAEPHETTARESLSPLKSDIAGLTDDLSSEGPDTKLAPVPKKRTILFVPPEALHDADSPFLRWGDWRGSRSRAVPPRGILKHSTSWSSNDSGLPHEGAGRRLEESADHQTSWPPAVALEGEPTEGAEDKRLDDSLYRKRERFSLRDATRGQEPWEGREFGDQDLLALDRPAPLDEESGEVEPGTSCEKNDGSNGLTLSQTVCNQAPEEECCPLDASRTLNDIPQALLLSSESKFSWMAQTKFSPKKRVPSPISEPQPHRGTGGDAEAGTGEAMAEREVAAMRWEDVSPPQSPVGYRAESNPPQVSYLPSSMDEKGTPVYGGMGSLEAPPLLELRSPEFNEGDSIAKVLEWFSRSTDSSDHQEGVVCQQEADVEPIVQPGASEDITKHNMVEDKGQRVVPKDDFTTVNQMAEHTLISDGSPTVEVQVTDLKWPQLERSASVEVACVQDTDKNQSLIEPEATCPTSAKEDSISLQNLTYSSLDTGSSFQPKLQMSVDTGRSSQKKENAIDIMQDLDRGAILLSPVTKATQQDVKQIQARNETVPQTVTRLKSFWERSNSGAKVPITRSSTTPKQNEIEPISQISRTKTETNVDLIKAGQEVSPRPKETCLDTKDEKEGCGVHVSYSHNHNFAQDFQGKGESIDMEDGVSEPTVQSILPLTQEDPLKRVGNLCRDSEVALTPVCVDKSLPLESSHLVESSEEEEKYIATCMVVDDDMEIPDSPGEGKTDLQLHYKEEVSSRMAPPSSHVPSLADQSSTASTTKQGPNQLVNKVEKIRHLKDFWESEKNGPTVITGKPKREIADTRESQFPTSPVHMYKNSTKSAFGLSMVATDNECRASPLKQGPNFTVISMKQRMEMASMDQSSGNSQFKSLRDFWGGATSQLPSTEKVTQLKGQESSLKGLENSQSPTGDKKPYLNPNHYPKLPSKDLELANFRAQNAEKYDLKTYAIDISSPKSEPKEKKPLSPTPLPRQESGSSDEINMKRSSKMSPIMKTKKTQSQQWSAEWSASPKSEPKEKKPLSPTPLSRQESGSSDEMNVKRSSKMRPTTKTKKAQSQQWPAELEQQNSPPHSCSDEDSDQAPIMKHKAFMAQRDPQQPRRPSLGNTTGKVHLSEEQQDALSKQLQNTQEELPSGRQVEAPERQPSQASNGGERPKPLARSFIPHDYHYYLGIPKGATFQTMPAAMKEMEAETSACFPPDLEPSARSGPVRSSTPLISEEPQARRGSELLYPDYGTDGVDLDSYRSSPCETWPYSGTSSGCDEEDTSVRRALERAKLRPVSFSKSVEDITLLPSREEEERSENTSRCDLMLSVDDASALPQSPPSFTSDPAQMKNMSKSVPAFLQEESSRGDSDSTSESSVHTGRQKDRIGSSLTNLSSSSGMSSVSGSVMSVYSGDFGNVDVRGTIQFSLNYVQKLKEFHIFVVQCRDLAAVDPEKNRSNPYVKSYLLPDQVKLGKRKTSVKKKTLNPNYNEILRYRVRMETLKTQILNLSVWHNDTFGRNSFLGEVEVDLSKYDFGNTQVNNLTLKPRIQSAFQASDFRGEIRLALRFLPEMSYGNKSSKTGEVHIWVKDCKDLPIIRGTSINPFVQCYVLPDTSRKSRQKTRILKRTQNPAFNHTMVYDGFKAEDLTEACVELTAWDYDHIASHFVGGLRLGLGTGKSYGAVVGWMDSSADEANLYQRMMDSPNQWVEDVLPLRMLTIAKNLWK